MSGFVPFQEFPASAPLPWVEAANLFPRPQGTPRSAVHSTGFFQAAPSYSASLANPPGAKNDSTLLFISLKTQYQQLTDLQFFLLVQYHSKTRRILLPNLLQSCELSTNLFQHDFNILPGVRRVDIKPAAAAEAEHIRHAPLQLSGERNTIPVADCCHLAVAQTKILNKI